MNIKKDYKNLILNSSSIKLFYQLFLILSVLMLLEINNFILMSVSLICLGVFVYRITIKVIGLKNKHYFDIESEDFNSDTIKRGEILRDLFSLIIFFFMALAIYDENILNKFSNSFIGTVLFFTIFYFLFAGISITKNSKVLKVFSILVSTVQGLLFVAFSITTIFITFINFISGESLEFLEELNSEFVVNVCYIIQSNLKVFIFIALISLSLLLILIILTPPSQLSDLGMSFKVINIIMVLLSVSIFFAVNLNWASIKEFVSKAHQSGLTDKAFKTYLGSFTKKNILNTGYLLILPYSLGILISNFTIENLKNVYTKKSKAILLKILKLKSEKASKDKISKLKLKYLYYGGDKFLLNYMDIGLHKKES